jgi:hypothetical protein
MRRAGGVLLGALVCWIVAWNTLPPIGRVILESAGIGVLVAASHRLLQLFWIRRWMPTLNVLAVAFLLTLVSWYAVARVVQLGLFANKPRVPITLRHGVVALGSREQAHAYALLNILVNIVGPAYFLAVFFAGRPSDDSTPSSDVGTDDGANPEPPQTGEHVIQIWRDRHLSGDD